MNRAHRLAVVSIALAATAATTACDHGPAPLVGLEETAALAAAVQEMSVDGVLDGLALDPSERAVIEAKLATLHESMLDLHALHPENPDALTDQEKADLHARLQAGMEGVHRLHHEFMESLSDDQRQRFVEHMHAAMAAHHEEAGDLHEGHASGLDRHAPEAESNGHHGGIRHR